MIHRDIILSVLVVGKYGKFENLKVDGCVPYPTKLADFDELINLGIQNLKIDNSNGIILLSSIYTSEPYNK